jgi:hypothetical protein
LWRTWIVFLLSWSTMCTTRFRFGLKRAVAQGKILMFAKHSIDVAFIVKYKINYELIYWLTQLCCWLCLLSPNAPHKTFAWSYGCAVTTFIPAYLAHPRTWSISEKSINSINQFIIELCCCFIAPFHCACLFYFQMGYPCTCCTFCAPSVFALHPIGNASIDSCYVLHTFNLIPHHFFSRATFWARPLQSHLIYLLIVRIRGCLCLNLIG